PLTKVSSLISKKLKNLAAEKQAESFADKLRAKLESGESVTGAELSDKKLQWVTTGYLGRYSTKVDTAILDLAFRLPNPLNVKASAAYGVTRVPDGFAVVAVKAVKDGSTENQKVDVFAEQVQNSEGMLEYELYKKSQMDNAKIKIYS